MARKQHNEVKAGIFALAALIVFVLVVLWMGAADWFAPRSQRVVFYAPAGAGPLGLQVGSMVHINDAVVGKVSRIDFDPQAEGTWYYADLTREGLRIHADARAEVVAPFIGSPIIAVLDPGDGDGEGGLANAKERHIALRVGGVMGGLQQVSDAVLREVNEDNPEALLVLVKQMGRDLRDAAGNIKEVTRLAMHEADAKQPDSLIRKMHNSADGVEDLVGSLRDQADPKIDGSLLAKVHGAVDDVRTAIHRLALETDPERREALLAKIHATVDDINAMTSTARPRVDAITLAAENTAKQIEKLTREDVSEMLANLRKTSEKALKVTGQVEQIVVANRDNIDELIDNMTLLSANLKATGEEVRRAPWKLFYRPDDEELRSRDIYDAARAYQAGAEQLDQALGKLRRLRELHPDGIPADDPAFRTIQKHLKDSVEKFGKFEAKLWEELSE